jgi:hypothetical protein
MVQCRVLELNDRLLSNWQWDRSLCRDFMQTIKGAKHFKHLFESLARRLNLSGILGRSTGHNLVKFHWGNILNDYTQGWSVGIHRTVKYANDWGSVRPATTKI